jgi:hypothetical protein
MILPNRDDAYISYDKLTAYLLSETHAVGRSKARFFREHGFDESNAEVLEERLLAIARHETVQDVVSSPYGTKYVIDRQLDTIAGLSVHVRTIWIVDAGQTRPRFVTAYPT